jgi:hypothetical protein
LKCFKGLVAFCTGILVSGHGRKRPRKSALKQAQFKPNARGCISLTFKRIGATFIEY